MKQIITLIITLILITVMSFPGYAYVCEPALVNAGADLKIGLDKAIDALPEKAAYDRARASLKQVSDQVADVTTKEAIPKLRIAVQHAKLSAPAEQVKLYEDLEKSLDDMKIAMTNPADKDMAALGMGFIIAILLAGTAQLMID